MSMPFYVSPEQMMKDRADYARKGIARGRALIAVQTPTCIVIVAENPSTTLRKVSEIYDRIAFAGVGKYNEFDQLRVAGVRAAELRGYQYSRNDVDARSLANQYAQVLGDVFSTMGPKPLEVELLVVAIADTQANDRLFHILYDGTLLDERRFCVLGGDAEGISKRMESSYRDDLSLDAAIKIAVAALTGSERTLDAADLEVAILTRNGKRRAFSRVDDAAVASALK
ncbi:MAG: proteasome alpha-type subunit [Actinomycetota bacterium]|jgi:proteasome alpha subunit|nr:proteasome subunit alpha [Ilumatobacteraceae bacterium]